MEYAQVTALLNCYVNVIILRDFSFFFLSLYLVSFLILCRKGMPKWFESSFFSERVDRHTLEIRFDLCLAFFPVF